MCERVDEISRPVDEKSESKGTRNPFRMRSYGSLDLKSIRMRSYKRQGGACQQAGGTAKRDYPQGPLTVVKAAGLRKSARDSSTARPAEIGKHDFR